MAIVENLAGLNIPDVYLREVEPPVQINGRSTGVVAVVGQFARGPLNTPTIVSDPSDLIRKFGSFTSGLDGFMFVYAMMRQGANQIKVVRVADEGATAATGRVSGDGGTPHLYNITFGTDGNGKGTEGNSCVHTVSASSASGYVDVEFRLGNEVSRYLQVNMTVGDENYLLTKVAQDSNAFVTLTRVAGDGVTTLPATGSITLSGGSNGTTTGSDLSDSYYVGTDAASGKSGIVALEPDDEVNFITTARHNTTINTALISQASSNNVSPRMALLSVPSGTSIASVKNEMSTINSDRVVMIYPWVKRYNPYTKQNEYASPVSYMAGVLSVLSPHVSPSRKQLVDVLAMERDLTRAEVSSLIDFRICPVTKLNGQGFVFRHGITTSSNGGKRQIVRRRMVNYLAIALEAGLQPFVSRPHTAALRSEVKTAISGFLERELRDGRIGNSQGGRAYAVICDTTNNPTAVVQANRLNVDVQVSFFAPADIIVVNLDASEEKTIVAAS